MFTIHLVAYTATVDQNTVYGIARVGTDHDAPTWAECVKDIPGYVSGTDLGIEPKYLLRYCTPGGIREKRVGSAGVETVGSVLMRCANRGQVWDIEVFDETGTEVTFSFGVFCD